MNEYKQGVRWQLDNGGLWRGSAIFRINRLFSKEEMRNRKTVIHWAAKKITSIIRFIN
jgi:hypothetical protein